LRLPLDKEGIVMKKWVPKELVDYTTGTTYENYPKER